MPSSSTRVTCDTCGSPALLIITHVSIFSATYGFWHCGPRPQHGPHVTHLSKKPSSSSNPWKFMESMEIHGIHGNPWNPWKSMESMEIHGIHGNPWNPWKSMEIHGIHGNPWKSMESVEIHGNPWNPWKSLKIHALRTLHIYRKSIENLSTPSSGPVTCDTFGPDHSSSSLACGCKSCKIHTTILVKTPHHRGCVGIMCHTFSKKPSSSSEFS